MSILPESPLITAKQLATLVGGSGCHIFDATVILPAADFDGDYRPASGYSDWLTEHIPGSRHADLLYDLAEPQVNNSFACPTAERLNAWLVAQAINVSAPLVIYDKGDGFWAARLWWVLHSYGLTAKVLDGGFRAWQQENFPTEHGPAVEVPQQFSASNARIYPLTQPPRGWINLAEVEQLVMTPPREQLICALPVAVFNGQAVTRYARRGHLPGSICFPARTLLDNQGRFLPRDTLVKVARDAGLSAEAPLVIYCGGGISAASLALGLTLAGFTRLRIYDGSLQEWAANPDLPLLTEDQ